MVICSAPVQHLIYLAKVSFTNYCPKILLFVLILISIIISKMGLVHREELTKTVLIPAHSSRFSSRNFFRGQGNSTDVPKNMDQFREANQIMPMGRLEHVILH